MAEDTDKRLAALEKENKELKQAMDRLATIVAKIEKRADRAYHASRDADNQIRSIKSVLRK